MRWYVPYSHIFLSIWSQCLILPTMRYICAHYKYIFAYRVRKVSRMKKLWHENFIYMHENECLPRNSHGCKFHAWSCVYPSYPWTFLGRENHGRWETFVFLHGNIIFMHETFLYGNMDFPGHSNDGPTARIAL